MLWSPQQDQALQAISNWHKGGDTTPQLFRLFGYAGTGKTTLAKEIAEAINGEVYFGTYTGKAAHVLRQKGCAGATTIHSLIYHPRDKSKHRLQELEKELVRVRAAALEAHPGRPVEQDKDYALIAREIEKERENVTKPAFSLNELSDVRGADLVIIDECSMVDSVMGEDLLSFGTKVLVLGDPAQLPPVAGSGFFIEAQPDFMLTEIHRQAQENPIIRMATTVREGGRLELGQYGESKVIEKSKLDQKEVLAADQVLVGKNITRHQYNSRIRTLLGYGSADPVPGDKLVCLRNNHNIGLLNGAIWHVEEIGLIDEMRIDMSVRPQDGGDVLAVNAHMHYFHGREKDLPWFEKREAEEFDYGYALTCHKAQGSQWGDVMVFDESWCFRNDRAKWLYTALTRAAEKVTVVKV